MLDHILLGSSYYTHYFDFSVHVYSALNARLIE